MPDNTTLLGKIAAVRLDALGDTLLSTPAIRALQGISEQVRVFVHPVGQPVLQGWAEAEVVSPRESEDQVAARLREFAPDAVVIFSEKRRAINAAWKSRALRRVGFDPGWTQPLKALWARIALTDRLYYPNDLSRDPGMHEVQRYLALAAKLGAVGEPVGLQLALTDEERHWGREWLRERGWENRWALQLTPKWGWPEEWLATLLEAPVGFFGPAEKDWATRHFGALDLCYQDDLRRYAAVLSGCRGLVTVDTGAAHVGAALGLPVVDVFPELHSSHCVPRWRPWRTSHRVVLKPAWSREGEAQLRERIRQAVQELQS